MALCAICFAVAWLLALLVAFIQVKRLTTAAGKASVADRSTSRVRAAVPHFVRGTPFADRWQVNGDYRSGVLNVYVIRVDGKEERLAAFRNNCSAATRWAVIVCDSAFLEDFLDRRGVFAGLHPDRVAAARHAFVAWTIGHEIGHVVAGDEPPHLKASALNEQIARASDEHRHELAADLFVVRQLEADVQRRLAVENLALDLVNSEIRHAVGAENLPSGAGLIFDYTNEHVVRYLDRGTHPEFFVRAARLLEAAGELPRNDGLREMVAPLIRQLGGERK